MRIEYCQANRWGSDLDFSVAEDQLRVESSSHWACCTILALALSPAVLAFAFAVQARLFVAPHVV